MYKIIATENTWMESEAVEQVKRISEFRGVVKAFGYPDLHPGKTPVGAAFITEKVIYPTLIGNDIGCSISLFQTSLLRKKFKIEKAMKGLIAIGSLGELHNPKQVDDDKSGDQNNFNLGTIGKGNHFGEFTEISEILDKEEFQKLALDKSKVYLLVHSGSRGLGEHILRKYIENYSCDNGLEEGTEVFLKYLEDYKLATAFARDNREIIAEKLCDAVNCNCEKLVIEAVHNGIEEKGGFYIHRKGSSPAEEDSFVVIAGSRGTSSYIVKTINASIDTGFSIAHGAGRKWKRAGCMEKLQGKFMRKDIKNGNMGYNLVCSDKNLIYEESPEAYKNIERVISDLEAFRMIKVVARLTPLITYKD